MPLSWALAFQVVGLILVLGNVALFYFQVALMRRQVLVAQDAVAEQQRVSAEQLRAMAWQTKGQNLFTLIAFLERPEHLHARAVAGALGGKDLAEWSEEDRKAADLVWRMWNIAAVFQKFELVPEHFLHTYYGSTILHQWTVLTPYVEQMRRATNAGRARDFQDLAEEVDRLGWFRDGADLRPAPTLRDDTGGDRP